MIYVAIGIFTMEICDDEVEQIEAKDESSRNFYLN